MNTQLAIPKKTYQIKIDGDLKVLMCENEIPRQEHMKKKDVVTIDGKIINFSYVSYVEEVDPKDETIDSAMARARKQTGAYASVAIERVRSYEANNGKMSIDKIMTWMSNFIANGRLWKDDAKLSKYYNIFIGAGGREDDLSPIPTNND